MEEKRRGEIVPVVRGVDGKRYDYGKYCEEIKIKLKAEMYDEWRNKRYKNKGSD